jgi:DUF218 domain-containing protein
VNLEAQEQLTRMILVAGHAVYLARSDLPAEDDRNWALHPFQKGEPPLLIQHVRRGVELAAADPGAGLVFSGGCTRAAAGPRSEAESYCQVAKRLRWWQRPEVSARTWTEDHARDSLENCLFGLARFRELTGRYPDRVIVVGWAFKARRFSLHARALRFPADRFTYEGVNDPVDAEAAVRGEGSVLEAFTRDPYAAHGDLAKKRLDRDPFNRPPPYASTCPELADLLRHTGPDIFPGPVPWSG